MLLAPMPMVLLPVSKLLKLPRLQFQLRQLKAVGNRGDGAGAVYAHVCPPARLAGDCSEVSEGLQGKKAEQGKKERSNRKGTKKVGLRWDSPLLEPALGLTLGLAK